MRTPKYQYCKATITSVGLLCAIALLSACGHKGALVRPSPKAPITVSASKTVDNSDGVTH
jgi:predicted small lipoprotein YifL